LARHAPWLPRKRDIRLMSDQDMKEICDRLNDAPGKCSGWQAPAEVFREKMLDEMSPYLNPTRVAAQVSRTKSLLFQPQTLLHMME